MPCILPVTIRIFNCDESLIKLSLTPLMRTLSNANVPLYYSIKSANGNSPKPGISICSIFISLNIIQINIRITTECKSNFSKLYKIIICSKLNYLQLFYQISCLIIINDIILFSCKNIMPNLFLEQLLWNSLNQTYMTV